MSWATNYSGSNNIDFNFPPIMADGRNYSSWQPDAAVNNRIRTQEGIQSNWGYRQFLQRNGTQIMNYNTQEYSYAFGLNPHVTTGATPSDNVPHTFKGTFDTSKPGFGYSNSDLKNPYLSVEQLNARLIAPSINPSDFR
jgi:hypothetical protein